MGKWTTEEFIKKAREVHGDRYDYSKVEYVSMSTKVCIICKEHGEFWQQPSNHLRGIGCPQCGLETRRKKRTHSFDDFLKSAKMIHGDKYDYSKVDYVNKKTKICIVCPKHGDFWQTPGKHMSGQGCEKCFRESLAKRYSKGKDKFVEKANIVHNGFYDYSMVDYVNAHTYVQIICPIHGAFIQSPASHLKGHGCPFCATDVITKKNTIWTYETCLKEARKYSYKGEFEAACPVAYNVARKKKWLDSYEWLKTKFKQSGYWTKERCEEESRKYQSRTDFMRRSSAAYVTASKNGWIDEYTWLLDKRLDIVKGKIDSVYVYVFEDTKTAYVGRTLIRRQKKRDKEHIFNLESDSVARYAKKHQVPVPPMKILESNLTLEEGQAKEDYWRKLYEQQGYTMLNRIATGVGRGSLGAIGQGKWNRKMCYKEAKKYKSSSEFEYGSSGAYSAARINGWLNDYTWFAVLKQDWNKERCFNEAKKYLTRGDFCKGCIGAYKKALKEGWIKEYTWLNSRQTKPAGYWDNYEHCYNEAMKYKNRRRFQKGCMGAYNKALKYGWLDDYTWFEEAKKPNGFWNRETCMEEAKKYASKKEFKDNANGAYQLAYKEGWLNDYTWFKPLTGFWTYNACKAEAAKYSKRSQFKAAQPGAYAKSRINGWLDDFFPK